jgi:hypothetical protein
MQILKDSDDEQSPKTQEFWVHSIFLLFFWCGTKSLGTAATSGVLYKPQMIDEGDCGAIDGMKIGRGHRSTRRKPAPAPLCPPQNPTWPYLGSNPGRRGGKPATNRLSYGAAKYPMLRLRLNPVSFEYYRGVPNIHPLRSIIKIIIIIIIIIQSFVYLHAYAAHQRKIIK